MPFYEIQIRGVCVHYFFYSRPNRIHFPCTVLARNIYTIQQIACKVKTKVYYMSICGYVNQSLHIFTSVEYTYTYHNIFIT